MGLRENIINSLASLLGVNYSSSDIQKYDSDRIPVGQPVGAGDVASRSAQLPDAWLTSTYGPGLPIQPFTKPEEVTIPREIDYPISINATLIPRTGYGLMPFSSLRDAYENITEVRMPVQTLLRELTIFRPHLVDKNGNEVSDHPYKWMTVSPDRTSPFDVWIARLVKSSLIFDAAALFKVKRDGVIQSMRYVDGSTLFVIVDQWGNIPKPDAIEQDIVESAEYQKKLQAFLSKNPSYVPNNLVKTDYGQMSIRRPKTPAFAQVIKGTPFGWYSQDDLWYKPRSRRYDAPYGETAIEQSWSWILICANITSFELAHYREGNMPEGYWQTPEGWSLEKIAAFETAWNRRMNAGAAERMRSRFAPPGFKWFETKKADFPEKLYERARDNIALNFGVPPAEFGKVPGQGLGGRGFAEMSQSALFRNGLLPLKTFVEDCFNQMLDEDDIDDVMFEMAMPMEDVDPDKSKEAVVKLFSNGIITLNDALGDLGMDNVDGGDIRVIVAGGTLTVLSDYLKGERPAQPGGAAPEEVQAEQTPVAQNSSDLDRAKEILQQSSESGVAKLSSSFISIPEVEKIVNSGNQLKSPISGTEAKNIAGSLGVSQDIQTPKWIEQFRIGLEEELEHTDVTGGDPKLTGKIVLAHLKEDPQYYGHSLVTQKMKVIKLDLPDFKKHCGVCPEDDEYFNAPIAREYSFELPAKEDRHGDEINHVNDVEIVAMVPEDTSLPPRPAIWKPEGGENTMLQSRVGGPLYPREEAAYLLDRALGFYLVPVSYVSESDSERGAVMYYVHDSEPSRDVDTYDPAWVERAAVFDYVSSQTDRNTGNWLTHPDDPSRMVLIDNGLGFPADDIYSQSPFCVAMYNIPLSSQVMRAMKTAIADAATWQDISELIGGEATAKAQECMLRLINEGVIKPMSTTAAEYTQEIIEGSTPVK